MRLFTQWTEYPWITWASGIKAVSACLLSWSRSIPVVRISWERTRRLLALPGPFILHMEAWALEERKCDLWCHLFPLSLHHSFEFKSRYSPAQRSLNFSVFESPIPRGHWKNRFLCLTLIFRLCWPKMGPGSVFLMSSLSACCPNLFLEVAVLPFLGFSW